MTHPLLLVFRSPPRGKGLPRAKGVEGAGAGGGGGRRARPPSFLDIREISFLFFLFIRRLNCATGVSCSDFLSIFAFKFCDIMRRSFFA